MFDLLARFTTHRSRLVLYLSGVLLVVAGALGGSVISSLSAGGFTDDSTESARTAEILDGRFGSGAPNLTLLVSDKRGVDDPAVAAAGARLTKRIAAETDVEQAISYWSLGKVQPLRGKDGNSALVLVRIAGDEDEVQDVLEKIQPKYEGQVEGLDTRVGGSAVANKEITETTQDDLLLIEMVTFPVLLIVMLFVFRTVVAALVPLMVSGLTIVSVLLTLRILTLFTDVSVLATNVATGLGLGLAIDYSLILIKRYREELHGGADTDTAIRTALRTAGRTVLFSAATVALALAGLLVFPFYFLRSFAYAGIPTALLAALVSVTFLPALLKALGPRIEKGRILGRKAPKPELPESERFWYRLATKVMRYPIVVTVAVVGVLLVLGSPFLDLRMSMPDDRVLPADTQSREVSDILRKDFNARESEALNVVLNDTPAAGERKIDSYAEQLSSLDNVARVDSEAGSFAAGKLVAPPGAAAERFGAENSTFLSVIPKTESMSEAGEQLVDDIRGTKAPYDVQVGGPAAELVDSLDVMYDRLPIALGIIGVTTFILLFLFTGSLVLPLKALILNCLSLSATFGVLVWGFQDGHLEGLVGDFVVTDSITWTVPLLLFCIAFGMSMDYEVFLLSRIKEEWDRSADNTLAVARGLERTGAMVTAAAALIAIVWLGFLLSGIAYLKAIGLGLALAVLMDATLVRGALVPAFMKLAGRANWWAPGPLARFHQKYGLREAPESEPVAAGIGEPAPDGARDEPARPGSLR
ncbi:putative membrane protein [Streptomyces albus]|uniref:Putative membrane protein n=1 Tax=Streptomyces albus (strain ATCC 21838 / DSM 41398 / FERM P-419 / JCM 4703 / NBRC 107858) TaxID=1081613 RepID=A0A0B5EH36_STRA4|nr:putative membrane protein [Streptomyces albus]AOU75783.1 putative membrane protein [Streptomyces albus]AYN31587.1 transporter [Streptomyces albus]